MNPQWKGMIGSREALLRSYLLLSDLLSLSRKLSLDPVFDVHIRSLGGDFVVLTFPNVECKGKIFMVVNGIVKTHSSV
ncbi:hypothetical protein RHGRI_029101 [Rhododendron griersonianum]|uniref:Uncharacterized protein n=1 Tax=Rhododendron griersonianum TaxID=479676 RepID=A0AAV6INN0_9ERIC|nr:hypothetical protein RHGRI_029101 [Rhododendron griersonianum]